MFQRERERDPQDRYNGRPHADKFIDITPRPIEGGANMCTVFAGSTGETLKSGLTGADAISSVRAHRQQELEGKAPLERRTAVHMASGLTLAGPGAAPFKKSGKTARTKLRRAMSPAERIAATRTRQAKEDESTKQARRYRHNARLAAAASRKAAAETKKAAKKDAKKTKKERR